MKNAQAYAIQKTARISPKKVTPVMNLIRGKSVYESKVILALDPTKAAKFLLKVVKSAEANAKSIKLPVDSLYVTELWVGDSMSLKRGHATARGKFAPAIKRSSNIYVGLNERKSK
jgi:large subunit ribosomal protein L22